LPFTVRFTVEAEALAVHLSGKPVPAEADRFFRPESMSAEAGILPGWLPVKAEALAARLRSAVPAEADRFLRSGSPSEPKLFRFSFGGPVKPKPLVPPGCSTKLAGPCKS
jgi:hypothetical protein